MIRMKPLLEEYDFEGSLDDFELWLNTMKTFEGWLMNLKTETYPLMKQKEMEWEKTAKELRDLISKVQKRIEHEKREDR